MFNSIFNGVWLMCDFKSQQVHAGNDVGAIQHKNDQYGAKCHACSPVPDSIV